MCVSRHLSSTVPSEVVKNDNHVWYLHPALQIFHIFDFSKCIESVGRIFSCVASTAELKEENISNPTGCFQAVDRDNSGYITVGELGMLGGGKLGNTKTEALMDKLDTDKDGRISLEEFRKLFKEK